MHRRFGRDAGLAAALWMILALSAEAQDAVVGGPLTAEPTTQHVGLRWQISGDANLNASCSVRYRRSGTQLWASGLDLVRTHAGLTGEGGDRPDNRFAGSVFFLDAETQYDFELNLEDADGGSEVRLISASTITELSLPLTPRDRHVVPGTGGGSGTAGDPFLGLQAAADDAMPGDVFHLSAGVYEPFSLVVSGTAGAPIVIRGPVDPTRHPDESTWAVLDGAATDRGIIELGRNDRETSYILVERLAVQNGRWGVDAQHTHHVTFRRNVVRDVDDGFLNRRDGGAESHQVVSDNVFSGRNVWPDVGIPGERGVDLRGQHNIIRYNRMDHFADGASLQPFTGGVQAHANDIHGNDLSEMVDDPIEIDYNVANTRVWRNRVVNSRMGVSVAPIHGGPAYVFRNEFFNLESSAYKMNRQPSGLVIFHNTSAKVGNGTSSPAGWQNTWLRNNVLIGTRYTIEEYGLVPGSVDDWDYDALGTTDTPFAKWDDIRYQDLNDLRLNSGIEANATSAALADLVDAVLPTTYQEGVTPGSYDLNLGPGVPAVDAGQSLPNVNDPFVFDGLPDIGAHERGERPPQYGPRPKVLLDRADLSALRSADLPLFLQASSGCPGGTSDTSGTIGRTRIPAAGATAVHEIPDPMPLRLSGAGAHAGTNPLRFFEIEDSEATTCAAGATLFVTRDASRVPADLVLSWR